MNLLPNINNTIINLGFQGSLADTGGNSLSASTLNAFTSAPGGTEQYGTIDSCLQGFKFDGSTKLILPSSSLLRRTDPWTVEFLMYQPTTIGGNQSWFCLVDPAGRSGGAAADRIGSIFTFFWSNLTPGPHPYWSDLSNGSNLPVPGGVWWTTSDVAWGAAVHAVAVRYVPTPGVGAVVDLFVDGNIQATSIAQPLSAAESVTGVERFYIGGCEGPGDTPAVNSLLASFRMVAYGRTNAQISADAAFMLSPTCSLTPHPPVTDNGPPPYVSTDPSGRSGIFIPNEIDDRPILRGKAGLSMQTGFKERSDQDSFNIYCLKNIRAAAQAANVYRQGPKIFTIPDDGRST